MRLCLYVSISQLLHANKQKKIGDSLMKNFVLFFIALYMPCYPLSYKPSFTNPCSFLGEPRLTKDWLTTVNLSLTGGHSTCGHNGRKEKVNVLNIYGCENFHMLAKEVPDCILNCNPNGFINNLWQQDAALTNFGQVGISGKFAKIEFEPTIVQNLIHGFFLSLTIPIEKYSIREITYDDQTTKVSSGNNIDYYQWQSFINNIECNLKKYGLCIGNCKEAGLSDIQLLGGWSYNYENTEFIDFLDFTIALGINIPTGKIAPASASFCLSLGNDGHVGVPFIAMISVGLFDWLTLGLNGETIWFKDKTRLVAMKTAIEQQGWIKLASGYANVDKGTIWRINPYFKFDHLIGGFSFIIGFSHDHANQTHLAPCNTDTFKYAIVNSDESYKSWNMSSFHFVFEFDFASFKHSWAPHLAFTIDKSMCGKRVFDSAIFGAYITCDIEW